MDNLLTYTCYVCDNLLLEPIALPCSHHICKYHLDDLINQSKSKEIFDCKACNSDHLIPKNGYFFNTTLLNIKNLNKDLFENQIQVMYMINKLKQSAYDLEVIANDPHGFIFNYISDIRNKIDLEREKLIAQINSFSNKILDQLKAFENDCKQNVENLANVNDFHKEYLVNLTNKVSKWEEEIRTSKIDKTRINDLTKVISQLIKSIEEKNLDYKNKLLMNKGCAFIGKGTIFDLHVFGNIEIDEKINIKSIEMARNCKFKSNILNPFQSMDLIDLCDFDSESTFKLLYRASVDGFSAKAFHEKCDGIPKTLTIIKVNGNSNVFGGYCDMTWDSFSGYKKDSNAFIFSLINKQNNKFKINVRNSKFAIYCAKTYGPTFGEGYDVYLSNNSSKDLCYTNLGHSYFDNKYAKGNKANYHLAGSYFFTAEDVEVYQVLN